MSDWYLKTVLTVIALALAVIAFQNPIVPTAQAAARPTAHAAGQICEWTHIGDRGAPEIGEGGKVDMSDKHWAGVATGGWRLVGATDAGYVFERCK